MNSNNERDQKILSFLKDSTSAKGYPPTIREICEALDISSTATVHSAITRLEKKGYLKKDPAKTRAISLVDDSEEEIISIQSENRADVVDVPIVGRVAAGIPILAIENIEDTFPVPASFVGKDNFMLRVHGESMINAGILNGDLILVEKQNTARNGDIVVAMIDSFESEVTVKTFYREKEFIRLQPENDSMTPIYVIDVTIVGKVKGVFRYYN